MWCSIFQASFFAYVNSPHGREIEQILYFTRLFADLVGRPLTRLPRPYFIQTKNQLLIASMLRISLMVLFFVYILVPSFPKSDAFVTILVAIFSIMNGTMMNLCNVISCYFISPLTFHFETDYLFVCCTYPRLFLFIYPHPCSSATDISFFTI